MTKFAEYSSKFEKLSIDEIITEIQKRNFGMTKEYIANAIGYNRTQLSKSIGSKNELILKMLLIYRFLNDGIKAKTPSKSKEEEGVISDSAERDTIPYTKILNEINDLKINLAQSQQEIRGLAEMLLKILNTNLHQLTQVQGVSIEEVRDTLNKKDVMIPH